MREVEMNDGINGLVPQASERAACQLWARDNGVPEDRAWDAWCSARYSPAFANLTGEGV